MKVTLLVRHPDFPDGTRNLVMTDDTLPDAIRALQVAAKQDPGAISTGPRGTQ
jgi:hypothetical protein